MEHAHLRHLRFDRDETPGTVRIGIDLGGTKIEGVALDERGAVQARERAPTPKNDYEGTVAAIATLVGTLEERIGGEATVGIGMPGAISPATGLVKNANSTWLNGRALQEDLHKELRRDVRLANDANCFTLSEAVDGAAARAGLVFGVIVGTGCGGGIAWNRRVWTGPNAIGGEWGHNALPWPRPEEWPGPSCYCGKTGCIETFLSGTGLSRDYLDATGERLDAQTIIAATTTDDRARKALSRYVDRMARALAAVINVLDPDVIVLGGGMSNVAALYDEVPRQWGRYVFSDRVDTRLVAPAHGDSSGVRGAAWLWPARE